MKVAAAGRSRRPHTRRRGALVVAALALPSLTAAAPALAIEGSRFRPAVESRGGVVATESAAAARVGRAVLRAGGNAIDAAAATTFAVGVARPQSCGIGGGGFLVYRSAGGRIATLDFRETAPAAVTATTFAGPGPHRTFTGHRTVGVPGTVAGMAAALDRFGTISFAEAVSPASRLAQSGTNVPPSLSTDMTANAERLRLFPESARIFLDGGAARPAGARLRQPALAATLRLIARGGPEAFYRGRVAERIVASMGTAAQQLAGDVGLMTRADLAAYRAKWREPLVGSYRGRTVIAMPPPTSGGIATLEMLNLLEGFDLRALGQASADELHLIAESQKIAFADRGAYVGDPDFVRVPTGVLTSKPYAARRRVEIDRARAKSYRAGDVSVAARAAGADLNPRASTTHISVVDATGNAVALTCTIEQSFGSAVTAPGTGVLLNNELTDFSDPGTANEPGAGKRPRSSIAPTIVVERGRPVMAVGGAGGVRIIMGSLFAVVNRVDFGQDVARAVDGERLDAAATAGRVTIEERRVAPTALADLRVRGHVLAGVGEYDTRPRVQAAGVDRASGMSLGVSDPRADFGTLANRRPAAGARAWSGREDIVAPRVRLALERTDGTAELSARASDRGGAGVAYHVFQARPSGGGDAGWTTLGRSVATPAGARARSESVVAVDLGRPGSYRFRVRASDRAGNVSAFDGGSARLRTGAVRVRLEQ